MSQPPSPDSPRTEAPDDSSTPPDPPPTFLIRCLAGLLLLFLGFLYVGPAVFSLCDTIFHTPRFYLSDIHAPPLNATRDAGPATVLCKFTIQNTAWFQIVQYDTMFISLRDPSGQVASAEIRAFRLLFPCKVQEEVSLQLGLDKLATAPWNASADTTVFRVSLQTRYWYCDNRREDDDDDDDSWSMFRVSLRKSINRLSCGHGYEVRVGADVEVDAEGTMTSGDGILLA